MAFGNSSRISEKSRPYLPDVHQGDADDNPDDFADAAERQILIKLCDILAGTKFYPYLCDIKLT